MLTLNVRIASPPPGGDASIFLELRKKTSMRITFGKLRKQLMVQ